MKALVVGGTGFVGMNVVRALVQAGHDVVATRRAHANTLFARKLGARLVVAELDDESSLVEAMRDREVVFMCAGHYPRYSLRPAGEAELAHRRAATVFGAALRAGVHRCVLTSSIATVGHPKPPRTLATEADGPDHRASSSAYYASKWAVECEAKRALERGLDVVTLCPTGIIGELNVKVGTGFVLVALATGRLRFYVDGLTNIVDADLVSQAHLLAAERGRAGDRYIVAGHNLTIRDLLVQAAEELAVPLRARPLPARMAGWLSSLDEWRCARQRPRGRPFLPREFVDLARFGGWVDGSAAVEAIGLPAAPPLRATLRKAIDWYARYRYIPSQAAVENGTNQTRGKT